ncbi:MAG: hypothetical protein ACOC5F_00440 [Candidatus Aminicenantaceae bacterium]
MMKKAYLFTFVLLILSLLSFSFVRSQETQETVLPPDIIPVVFLQGSDYEMGAQYGKQAGKYILKVIESYRAEALRRFSQEEVIKALKANQHYIKNMLLNALKS